MSQLDVIAIGRAGLDLYAEQVGAPFEGVRSFAAYVGGTPANIAVGLRRLGLRSALVTAVSDDPVGDFIVHFLDDEGVDTRFVRRKTKAKSGLVLLGIHPPDDFPRVHYRENAADQRLEVTDVEAVPLSDCRMVVVVGTSLTHSPGREATLRAAEIANRSGVEVIVDLDYRADLWPSQAEYARNIGELIQYAATVIGTTEELQAAVPGADRAEAAESLLKTGLSVVVEKRGPAGCTIYGEGLAAVEAAGFKVDVQNTLGAGDAFAAGFMFGRLQGWDLRRSARFGNACGAIVVTRHACSASCPTAEEVTSFIETHGGTDASRSD